MVARPPTIFEPSYFREHDADWRAEKLLDDGEPIEVAIFSGRDARQRSIRYADREYRDYDEISVEPYSREPSA